MKQYGMHAFRIISVRKSVENTVFAEFYFWSKKRATLWKKMQRKRSILMKSSMLFTKKQNREIDGTMFVGIFESDSE